MDLAVAVVVGVVVSSLIFSWNSGNTLTVDRYVVKEEGAGDDAEGAVDVAKARKQVLVVSKRVVNVRRAVNHERRRAHLTRRSAIRLRPVGGVKQEFMMGKPRRGREH